MTSSTYVYNGNNASTIAGLFTKITTQEASLGKSIVDISGRVWSRYRVSGWGVEMLIFRQDREPVQFLFNVGFKFEIDDGKIKITPPAA